MNKEELIHEILTKMEFICKLSSKSLIEEVNADLDKQIKRIEKLQDMIKSLEDE